MLDVLRPHTIEKTIATRRTALSYPLILVKKGKLDFAGKTTTIYIIPMLTTK